MKIGVLISRIGGVDGVALETEKWIHVLRKLGHKVRLLAGKLERPIDNIPITTVPELDFHHPSTLKEQREVFFEYDRRQEQKLTDWLMESTAQIKGKLVMWLEDACPDLLVIQNTSALPSHLRLGMAVREVVIETGIPTIAHNHDFAWERGGRYDTRFRLAKKIVGECFPLIAPNVKQVVINTYNQKRIREIYNVDSVLIPNVMDFSRDYARNPKPGLRSSLGLADTDILLFQITRIVKRKNIEAAIALAARLKDPRVKLVVTGSANDDLEGGYYEKLVELARSMGVGERVLFAGRYFRADASPFSTIPAYSLEDAYGHADACTYFSHYEGFGNAFTEAVLARKPVFVNNYQPVYWEDIGRHGFKTVQLEGGRLTDEAVEKIREVLADSRLRQEMVEHNFELGAKLFSYEVLERKLSSIIG